MITYTTDRTGLTDEERKGWEFNNTRHSEETLDKKINRTNKSSVQFTIFNQRRNKR